VGGVEGGAFTKRYQGARRARTSALIPQRAPVHLSVRENA
jgi:hypothetical protein